GIENKRKALSLPKLKPKQKHGGPRKQRGKVSTAPLTPNTQTAYYSSFNFLRHCSSKGSPDSFRRATESAMKKIEDNNTLVFLWMSGSKSTGSNRINYDIDVAKVNTQIGPDREKKVYAQLAPDYDALDVSAMKKRDKNTLVIIMEVKVNKPHIKQVVKKLYDIDMAKVNTLIGPDRKKKTFGLQRQTSDDPQVDVHHIRSGLWSHRPWKPAALLLCLLELTEMKYLPPR
ncbi:LOW QUALITY PROTEIN: 60S ribosomal protein L23a, partial [Galemys pyrenaicus]